MSVVPVLMLSPSKYFLALCADGRVNLQQGFGGIGESLVCFNEIVGGGIVVVQKLHVVAYRLEATGYAEVMVGGRRGMVGLRKAVTEAATVRRASLARIV